MLPEAVDITGVATEKKGLNGKIWQKGGVLKPQVRENLLKIAESFYKFLEIPYPIKDIYFTGSLSNYNWTEKSDIDVHVLFDLENEDEFLSNYIFAKKAIWVVKHHITVYGYPVELFAKNVEEELDFKAIYSLMHDKWVKRPRKNDKKVEVEIIQQKAQEIADSIDELETMDDEEKIAKAEEIKQKINRMRVAGLEKGGEFSNENLIFKVLRNNGYIEKIGEIETTAFDKTYTLREKTEIIRESQEYFDAPKKKSILKIEQGIDGMDDKKINIIKDFINFTCNKLDMEEPVTVVLRNKKDGDSIITTASYLPHENENHIRAGGRAIVDICRSIGHELTHNRQRELHIFDPGDNVPNIGYPIENQANAIAGILIKDFALNNGHMDIYD